MKFGLSDEVIEMINRVFGEFPTIQQVVIYGSRAKGNYRAGSDIDLIIKGEGVNNHNTLTLVQTRLESLPILYKIDLSCYDALKNPDLIEHIDRVGCLFYIKS